MRAESLMLPLGTQAPDFTLPDPSGKLWSLDQVSGDGPLVVVFACNHCPFVKHVGPALGQVASDLITKGASVVAIMSNDVENYPDDAPPLMATTAQEWGWDFPYLYDETQDVAKAYGAACTPDTFVFDSDGALAYRGQLDDSRPSTGGEVTCGDLASAVTALLAGEAVAEPQKASMGCGIKWKPGNEPAT